MKTKNDLAWEGLFEAHRIQERLDTEAYVTLSANDLRQFREPRLMVKIDQSQNRPEIFRKLGLNVIALSDRTFAIGDFDLFFELPELSLKDLQILPPPNRFETLQTRDLKSETAVLHAAYLSGMVSSVFGKEMLQTVSGKTSSGTFEFSVGSSSGDSVSLMVDRARIEVDGGYEGEDVFAIFEVKLNFSDNFNIRQLYYPYRAWSDNISKDLVPTFLNYSDGIFRFYEIDFPIHEDLTSAQVIGSSLFAFDDPFVPESEVDRLLASNVNLSTVDVPFPQADKFDKVIDLLDILSSGPKSVEEISSRFAFEPRQADYYFNAARFLGLAATEETSEGLRTLTALGYNIALLPPSERNLELMRRICGIPVFRDTMKKGLSGSTVADMQRFAEEYLREHSHEFGLSGSTVGRRARTVSAWCNWILELSE